MVCHEGLLQKFALPGILEWMAFMHAISLMLRIIRVCADAPLSLPLAREFGSACDLSCRLYVVVKGELENSMFATVIAGNVELLRSVCSQMQAAHGDAQVMNISASFLFEFLGSLTNGKIEKTSDQVP